MALTRPVARPRFCGKALAIVVIDATSLPHMAVPWSSANAQRYGQGSPRSPETPPSADHSRSQPPPPATSAAHSAALGPAASVSRPQWTPTFEPSDDEMLMASSCCCDRENLLLSRAE